MNSIIPGSDFVGMPLPGGIDELRLQSDIARGQEKTSVVSADHIYSRQARDRLTKHVHSSGAPYIDWGSSRSNCRTAPVYMISNEYNRKFSCNMTDTSKGCYTNYSSTNKDFCPILANQIEAWRIARKVEKLDLVARDSLHDPVAWLNFFDFIELYKSRLNTAQIITHLPMDEQ